MHMWRLSQHSLGTPRPRFGALSGGFIARWQHYRRFVTSVAAGRADLLNVLPAMSYIRPIALRNSMGMNAAKWLNTSKHHSFRPKALFEIYRLYLCGIIPVMFSRWHLPTKYTVCDPICRHLEVQFLCIIDQEYKRNRHRMMRVLPIFRCTAHLPLDTFHEHARHTWYRCFRSLIGCSCTTECTQTFEWAHRKRGIKFSLFGFNVRQHDNGYMYTRERQT